MSKFTVTVVFVTTSYFDVKAGDHQEATKRVRAALKRDDICDLLQDGNYTILEEGAQTLCIGDQRFC